MRGAPRVQATDLLGGHRHPIAPYHDVILRAAVATVAFSLQIEHLPVGLRHDGI
jgi:hypothetical protein